MTSPRPRRRPLPGATTATLASLNVLGSTHSLGSLARWRPHGLVGGYYPAPRRPSSLRSTCSARPTRSIRPLVDISAASSATTTRRRDGHPRLVQRARLDSLAQFARSLASSRPRRRPLSGATTAILASFNSLGSTHLLGSLARWHPPHSTCSARLTRSTRLYVGVLTASSSSSTARRPHSARPAPSAGRRFTGAVGGRTSNPRRPSPTCPPTCSVHPRAP